jgi:two-component system NtrC family sensor kinase
MGQLVSGVAHELNNPLAGVLAVSELLLASRCSPPRPRPTTWSRGHARGAARAGRGHAPRGAPRRPDGRAPARLRAPARPARAPADVNRALVDALDLRRAALRLAGVDLAVELDYELPPAWADAHQLQQVFLNLITNAEYALAGHDGARRLTLRSRPAARAGGAPWIAVEVSDSGPGLAPGEELRVFEPFYTTKPEGAGTGLGLAVSAGIVREHGGELRAERAPAGGATFVVELPAGGVPHAAPVAGA